MWLPYFMKDYLFITLSLYDISAIFLLKHPKLHDYLPEIHTTVSFDGIHEHHIPRIQVIFSSFSFGELHRAEVFLPDFPVLNRDD